MTIEEFLRANDIYTYRQLDKMRQMKQESKKKEKVELGDSIENLMKANSYKRVGRRIKQRGWST